MVDPQIQEESGHHGHSRSNFDLPMLTQPRTEPPMTQNNTPCTEEIYADISCFADSTMNQDFAMLT